MFDLLHPLVMPALVLSGSNLQMCGSDLLGISPVCVPRVLTLCDNGLQEVLDRHQA